MGDMDLTFFKDMGYKQENWIYTRADGVQLMCHWRHPYIMHELFTQNLELVDEAF
jgi:hypothetical protein